jgi:cytochrome b involved in lipid metabolism
MSEFFRGIKNIFKSKPLYNLKKYSVEDVKVHDSKESCWVIVNKNVYDVTKLLNSHSGGFRVLFSYAASDATEAFEKHHNNKHKTILNTYLIGYIG